MWKFPGSARFFFVFGFLVSRPVRMLKTVFLLLSVHLIYFSSEYIAILVCFGEGARGAAFLSAVRCAGLDQSESMLMNEEYGHWFSLRYHFDQEYRRHPLV